MSTGHLRPPKTGCASSLSANPNEYGGFYLWRSLDDVTEYRESELAATIAAAYRGAGAPTVDVFEIVMPLRTAPDSGHGRAVAPP